MANQFRIWRPYSQKIRDLVVNEYWAKGLIDIADSQQCTLIISKRGKAKYVDELQDKIIQLS